MKLLEFKNAKQGYDDYAYAVHLDCQKELDVYEATHDFHNDDEYKFWDYFLNKKVGKVDDDVMYYFTHYSEVPEVGETFALDDMVWERVA